MEREGPQRPRWPAVEAGPHQSRRILLVFLGSSGPYRFPLVPSRVYLVLTGPLGRVGFYWCACAHAYECTHVYQHVEGR